MNHEQIRYYLHIGRQELTGAECHALDEHLAVCVECRAYSTQLSSLQQSLSRVMATRWSGIHPSADIESKVKSRGGRILVQNRMLQFTSSLASAAMLVALIVAFSWVFRPAQFPFTAAGESPTNIKMHVQPEHPVQRLFAREIMLLGFALEPKDSTKNLKLFWFTVTAPTHDYAAFVHLFGSQGNLVAQIDHPSMGGRMTSQWKPDEIVVDEYELDAQLLSAGTCNVQVGLYRPETGERLLTDENADVVDLTICDTGK